MKSLPHDWTAAERNRFQSYIDKRGDDECWPWLGRAIQTGRGYFQSRGRRMIAPRVAYAMAFGSFDFRLVIMHSCDDPNCVNPAHLRAGTRRENIADRDEKQRNRLSQTHCVNGHEFTQSNTRFYGPRLTWRMCRACARERSRAFRASFITREEAEAY